jgi:putative tryptophan/tyrosine transport system substrate-binding protein
MAIVRRCRFRTCHSNVAASLARLALSAINCAVLASLILPIASEAEQSKTIPRLCFLTFEPGTLQTRSPRFDAFFQALRDLGYVDGRSINIDYLSAAGDGERFPALADECVRLKADVIVPSTTPAARAAKDATHTIPIVMVALGDPVRTGLVDSLDRPGGNITGMSQMVPEVAVKRLELLKEAAPGILRVMVLSYLVDPIAPLQVKAMMQASKPLGMTLIIRDIRSVDDLHVAFDTGVNEGAQALMTTGESLFVTLRAQISELASRYKLPGMHPFSIQVVDGGGLMAYHVVDSDLHVRAAGYVDKILKGARPSDLPVQQPSRFHLVINLKAAKELGLTIPPTFLARADEVIE